MATEKYLWTLFLAAFVLNGCVVVERDRERRRDRDDAIVSCGGTHRLRVLDLDMLPDPVSEGQRIDKWLVGLQADSSGECRTTIRIREDPGNDIVGRETVFRLHPGRNEIGVDPVGRYRFSRREHCFAVLADIAGTVRRLDASRRFCARSVRGLWTMK